LERYYSYSDCSDKELVQLWLNNHEEAFEALYRRYVIRLLQVAWQKTNSKELAKELVQESFLELYQHRHNLLVHTSLQGYLFTILRNKILNYYRHQDVQEKYRRFIQLRGEEHSIDSSTTLEGKEMEEKIRAIINQLPPQCRTVFLLSREEQLSNREIAEKLGISVNTVEQHIRKARRTIREGLG